MVLPQPAQFTGGRRPPPIPAYLFRPTFDASTLGTMNSLTQGPTAVLKSFNPFATVKVGAPVRLLGLALLHPPSATPHWVRLPRHPPHLRIPRGGVSLEAIATGDVRAVEWYVGRRRVRVEKAHPYTIAGDRRGHVFAWRAGWRGGAVTVRVRVVGIRGRAVERTWHLHFYRG